MRCYSHRVSNNRQYRLHAQPRVQAAVCTRRPPSGKHRARSLFPRSSHYVYLRSSRRLYRIDTHATIIAAVIAGHYESRNPADVRSFAARNILWINARVGRPAGCNECAYGLPRGPVSLKLNFKLSRGCETQRGDTVLAFPTTGFSPRSWKTSVHARTVRGMERFSAVEDRRWSNPRSR